MQTRDLEFMPALRHDTTADVGRGIDERRDGHRVSATEAIAVSVVVTVLNDAPGASVVLDALGDQIGDRAEIIVVDGGSRDDTLDVLRAAGNANPRIRVIHAPGANISRGRNMGIEAARGGVIALIDCGCRPHADWLARITQPFDDDPPVDFVAGVYRIDPRSLLERVVGLTTMRGQLDAFDPATFNPSARSMAFTKDAWRRAGGFPEWLYTAEDTLFDLKMRRLGVSWRFAGEAAVDWRPRGTMRAVARQFYLYGRGGGHTQLSRGANLYNLRNLGLTFGSVVGGCVRQVSLGSTCPTSLWLIVAALFVYFYVYAFHDKSKRVARSIGSSEPRTSVRADVRSWKGYVLALIVQWVVLLADSAGYVVGTMQRLADPRRYRDTMARYFDVASRLQVSEGRR